MTDGSSAQSPPNGGHTRRATNLDEKSNIEDDDTHADTGIGRGAADCRNGSGGSEYGCSLSYRELADDDDDDYKKQDNSESNWRASPRSTANAGDDGSSDCSGEYSGARRASTGSRSSTSGVICISGGGISMSEGRNSGGRVDVRRGRDGGRELHYTERLRGDGGGTADEDFADGRSMEEPGSE